MPVHRDSLYAELAEAYSKELGQPVSVRPRDYQKQLDESFPIYQALPTMAAKSPDGWVPVSEIERMTKLLLEKEQQRHAAECELEMYKSQLRFACEGRGSVTAYAKRCAQRAQAAEAVLALMEPIVRTLVEQTNDHATWTAAKAALEAYRSLHEPTPASSHPERHPEDVGVPQAGHPGDSTGPAAAGVRGLQPARPEPRTAVIKKVYSEQPEHYDSVLASKWREIFKK